MQPSVQTQLQTLTHKVETGLQAIDQLSQLVMILVTELRNPNRSPQSEDSPTDSVLQGALPLQLSHIRQFSLDPAVTTEDCLFNPMETSRGIPQNLRDNELVEDPKRISLHHKDVIEDEDSLEIHDRCGDSVVAPDMQIRRLMAQLTAAYNRIAALEEQLMSHRPSYKQDVR